MKKFKIIKLAVFATITTLTSQAFAQAYNTDKTMSL